MKNRNKQQDMQAVKWLFRISKKHIKWVLIYSVLSCVLSVVGVLTAFGTKNIVNGAVDKNLELLKNGALILILILAVQVIVKILSRNIFERIKAKIEIKIKLQMFETVLKKDYSEVSAFHSGEVLNRLTSDVGVVTDAIVNLIPRILSLVARLITAVVVLTAFDPAFSVIFVVSGALILILSRLFKGYLKSMHKKAQETDGKVRSFFQESVAQILVIKVFNACNQIKNKANQLMADNYKIRIKRATVSIFAHSGMQLAFSLGQLFAIVWGGYRVYQGIIDIGEMSAILQLVNQIQSPMSALSGIMPSFYACVASAERLMDFENLRDEIVAGEKITDVNNFYHHFESIKIKDLTFKYERDCVFENAQATINKGDFVAITGISGIGKSTLFKLLMGVISAQNGEILINSKIGNRLADSETRKLFSYVPQGNLLLSGSIYENLTFMNEGKSQQEIENAIRISCCDEFIKDLPQGLETKIGERGLGLSEGQAQRIAIARAILYGAPIILLDEATSALDEQTEKKLIENLRQLENKTLMIITHKKEALKVCNKELKIVESKIYIEELSYDEN